MRFTLICCFLFIHYSSNSQDYHAKTLTTENGLPSDQIYCATEDSKGYIWIGTKNGVARWDSKNFEYYTIKDGLTNNEVISIVEDSIGRIWFISFNNQLSYLYRTKIYNSKNDLRLEKINILTGSTFFPVGNQLYFLDANLQFKVMNSENLIVSNSKNKREIPFKSELKILFFNKTSFIEDLNEEIKKNGIKSVLTKIYSSNPNYRIIKPFPNFNTFDSIALLNIDSLFSKDFKISNLIQQKKYQILKPTNKIIYFNNQLLLIFNHPIINNFKQENILKIFLDKSNNLNYLLSNKAIFSTASANKTNQLDYQYALYNLDRNSSRKFLAATDKLFEVTNNFKTINLNYNIGHIKNVNYNKKTNSIFVGTGSGIFRIKNNKAIQLNTNRTYNIFINSKNTLWYSSLDNVYYSINFKDSIQNENQVILNPNFKVFVNEIKEDYLGNMIFATNNGVYIYNPDTKIKYWLNDTNLLSSNECNRIEIDPKDNSLWISTFHGLNHIKYDLVNGKLKFNLLNRFLKDDGLYANEINDFLIQGDSVWVATPKGLNLIHNKNYRPDTLKIPIHFNKFWVNDIEKSLDSVLNFRSDENSVSIDYSAIYYQRRDRLVIQYKLISNGDTIVKFLTESKINLLALKNGDYELQLYAYDQDYPYIRSEVKSIRFSIQPPFYKTWWFWVAIFSVIGSVVAYLYYRKMLRAKNRQIELAENQSKLNEYSLKSLQNQMNPHFIFNSLNTMQHLMTSNQDEEALNYLSDFSQLMREMLANSRLDTIHLSDEIDFLNKYIELEKVRFSNEFDLIWSIGLTPDEMEDIYIPAMLIQPIVENAIKHGAFLEKNKQGNIEIAVNLLNETMLQFKITNSKQHALSPSSRGNDTALKVIKERLELYQVNNIKGEFKLDIQDHIAVAIINIPI